MKLFRLNLGIPMQESMLLGSLHECRGQSISYVCPHSYVASDKNHCAHFVSHTIGYSGAVNCKNQAFVDRNNPEPGVLIRVDDIYNRLNQKTGFQNSLPQDFKQGLIFVTVKGNMSPDGTTMNTMPAKHVGIWYNDLVWNYSNNNDRVVSDTLEEFIRKFTRVYGGASRVVFFYGGFTGSFA